MCIHAKKNDMMNTITRQTIWQQGFIMCYNIIVECYIYVYLLLPKKNT